MIFYLQGRLTIKILLENILNVYQANYYPILIRNFFVDSNFLEFKYWQCIFIVYVTWRKMLTVEVPWESCYLELKTRSCFCLCNEWIWRLLEYWSIYNFCTCWYPQQGEARSVGPGVAWCQNPTHFDIRTQSLCWECCDAANKIIKVNAIMTLLLGCKRLWQ